MPKTSIPSTNTIRRILIYPPSGIDNIQLNTVDYCTLADGEWLNDAIINFYVKYITFTNLDAKQRAQTYIFSTFFYDRLTKISVENVGLTNAQKQYEGVKKWTKGVNLFDKDFIMIPINKASHWCLAIICFPALVDGAETVQTHNSKPAKLLKIPCRDNTNGPISNDSFFSNFNINSKSTDAQTSIELHKKPCILLLDSAGKNKYSKELFSTLRDYLTCEYRNKLNRATDHSFNHFNMPGYNLSVPLQTNSTDCGLYLLQFVEQFFKDPIKNFEFPIKSLSGWFETLVMAKKREHIANVIKDLIIKYNLECQPLPEIRFSTDTGQARRRLRRAKSSYYY